MSYFEMCFDLIANSRPILARCRLKSWRPKNTVLAVLHHDYVVTMAVGLNVVGLNFQPKTSPTEPPSGWSKVNSSKIAPSCSQDTQLHAEILFPFIGLLNV